MRQRASTKTQRRLRQQSRDPYALTDDVYSEAPTFRVGGLVTAVGVLQLVAALALGGFVFGGALLFCSVVLAALGLALLRNSDAKGSAQGLGIKQAISQLLALRRSALDYSLTLSIAQSQEYHQHTHHKELQIAVVPTSPTPQNVVATMALQQQAAVKSEQSRKTTPFVRDAPLATLNRVAMKPLPTINSFSVEATDELFMEKPRANSEPKQVLRSRPLLALKPKVQQPTPVKTTQDKKKKKSQVKAAPVQPKTSAKQESKTPEAQSTKPQQQRKGPEPQMPQVAFKKDIQLPAVLPQAEPKVVLPAVLPKAEPVVESPAPKPIDVAPAAAAAVPVVASLSVFPARKPLVEVARGEPAEERELVATRKVLLYLSPEGDSVMDLEDQEMEREIEQAQELQLERELESLALSMEEFPPLSPTMGPQTPSVEPPTNAMEPNFLLDIALEPISKPESKLISFNSLRSKPVGNAELRAMLDELDVMRLELDAAMARCTSLANGEEAKVSAPNSPDWEPEEEPIFCC